MSPYCWVEGCSCKGVKPIRIEDQLEELKYWVQEMAEKLDHFASEEYEYDSRESVMKFIKEIEEEIRKKTNEVMGYNKNVKS